MANTVIKLKRTSTAGNVPNPAMMNEGEFILNQADGNLFFLAANASVQRIGGSSPASFATVIANGTSILAPAPASTVRWIAGQNIAITGNVINNSIVIDSLSSGGPGFGIIQANSSNLVALTSNSLITFVAGNNIFLDANTINNSMVIKVEDAPDFQSIDIANSVIQLPQMGYLRLHTTLTGTRRPRISSISSLGRRIEYQEALADVNRAEIIPVISVAAPTVIGMAAPTVGGTNVLRTLSANNALSSKKRTQYRSAGTAAASASIRSVNPFFLRGNTSANGGFYFATTIGIAEVPPSQCAAAAFILTNVTTGLAATLNISTTRSFCGFGCDRSNSTLKWASSNNSGPANTIELGANFPVQNNAIYTMKIYAAPANLDQNVYWSIERVDEPAFASGVANPNFLPANNVFLTYQLYMNNGIAAQNSAFDLISLYLETLM